MKAYTSFNKPVTTRGFSLVELLVVITLFSIVALAVTGALVSIIDANNKARTQAMVQANLRVPVEIMVAELAALKEGTTYDFVSASQITFTKVNDTEAGFQLAGTKIQRCMSSSGPCTASDWQDMTGDDVEITSLEFKEIDYNTAGTGSHPLVQITVKAKAGSRVKNNSEFELQTTVSPQYYAPIL